MAIQLPQSRDLLASTWELEKVKAETLTTVEKALDLALSKVQAAWQKRKGLEGKRATLMASLDRQMAQEKQALVTLAAKIGNVEQQIQYLYIESELNYLQELTKSKIQQCLSEIQEAKAKFDRHTHTLHYHHNKISVDIPTGEADNSIMGGHQRVKNTGLWQEYTWFEEA